MAPMDKLSDEVVLAAGWNPKYAKILRIAQAGRAGVALVDGNGDGAEIEAEFWEYLANQKQWVCTGSCGNGPFGVGVTAGRNGSTVFMSGYAPPGEGVVVAWSGRHYEVNADMSGIWLFVRETDAKDDERLPEVVSV